MGSRGAVIVFGGDGFCGWPTSLHLSQSGYDVVVVDNFSRRWIDAELGAESLTPISTMDVRLRVWRDTTGKKITFYNVNVEMNLDPLRSLLRPDGFGSVQEAVGADVRP